MSVASFAPASQTPTPQVTIRRFQPDQPLARAQRTASVSADLEGLGAEDVELDVTLSLPAGVRAVQSTVAKPLRIKSSEGWSRLTWSLEAAEPMAADMVLELKAMDGSPVAHQSLRMLFLPPVEKFSPPYIPEPVPAPTSMLVGAPLSAVGSGQAADVAQRPQASGTHTRARILRAGESGGV